MSLTLFQLLRPHLDLSISVVCRCCSLDFGCITLVQVSFHIVFSTSVGYRFFNSDRITSRYPLTIVVVIPTSAMIINLVVATINANPSAIGELLMVAMLMVSRLRSQRLHP